MIVRSIPVAAAVCGLLWASSALAADFSRARCDNPKLIHFIETTLPRMVAGTTGQSFGQNFSDQKVASSATVSAGPNKLVCKVALDLSARGISRTVNGQFIIEQIGSKQHAHWLPGY